LIKKAKYLLKHKFLQIINKQLLKLKIVQEGMLFDLKSQQVDSYGLVLLLEIEMMHLILVLCFNNIMKEIDCTYFVYFRSTNPFALQ
jgi:hypothetical protein